MELSPEEEHLIAQTLDECGEESKVFGLVETENPCANSLAETLRQKIYEDYKDTVFREETFPDPAPRGPHGLANIKLKAGTTPKYGRPIPCHGPKMEFFRTMLEKWKSLKKLEPPEPSGWGSPMFLVPKAEGSKDPYRPVKEVRAVNAAAEADIYTIPLIDEILTRQGRKRMWAKLDLKDAFSQVPLAPEARPIFKITTPMGDFQPRIMLQGYSNSPSLFKERWIVVLSPFPPLPMHILMTSYVVRMAKPEKPRMSSC